MSKLLSTVASHAGSLSGAEFKLLMCMALKAENNPPTYAGGREQLADLIGQVRGKSTFRNISRTVKSLIDRGFLIRVHTGGFYEYAQYQFAFPYEEES